MAPDEDNALSLDLTTRADLRLLISSIAGGWPITPSARKEIVSKLGEVMATLNPNKGTDARKLNSIMRAIVEADKVNLGIIATLLREERESRAEQAEGDVFRVEIVERDAPNRKPPHDGGGDGGDGLTRHKG